MLLVKVDGKIKGPETIIYKQSNLLRTIRNGFVKVNGSWKTFLIWTIENPINQTLLDVDLYQLFDSPKNPLHIEFINNGLIGAMSLPQSLLINGFLAGTKITITNNGDIIGKGGNGNTYPNDGGNGGDAIIIANDCTIANNGRIGGGGGAGSSTTGYYQLVSANAAGGGGAGYTAGKGDSGTATMTNGAQGTTKTIYMYASITSGAGGDLGQDGKLGSGYNATNSKAGKAGKAINNTANTTSIFINKGTVLGLSDLEEITNAP